MVEEYTELATHAFQSLADAGTAWVNEVIPKEEDGVLKITNGKMTTVCTCKTNSICDCNCDEIPISKWNGKIDTVSRDLSSQTVSKVPFLLLLL